MPEFADPIELIRFWYEALNPSSDAGCAFGPSAELMLVDKVLSKVGRLFTYVALDPGVTVGKGPNPVFWFFEPVVELACKF